jgi:hypothetical protein
MHTYLVYWRKPVTDTLQRLSIESDDAYQPEHYEDYVKLVNQHVGIPVKNVLIRVK